MLALTDRAAEALAQRLAGRGPEASYGFRLVPDARDNGARPSFRLQAAAAPEMEDVVVECGRARDLRVAPPCP